MSIFDINLKLQPSESFIGILAELNERFSSWTDGTYDWANQTTDFLHAPMQLPAFDDSLYKTPLSRRAMNDLLQMTLALLSGNYMPVREYLKPLHYVFVIGYPRSGGSYLTKELLRGIGLDHTRVSETLAHDGFPDLRQTWYDWIGNKPYYHLQGSVFETAEFLTLSHYYYRNKTQPQSDGRWLVPKKFHKLVNWAGSFKMLLGQGRADYLVTVRHPVPTAISVYEKSGGLPVNGKFPAARPRSAIEHWIVRDLQHLGYSTNELMAMEYFEAVCVSWTNYYLQMATSGLFLGERDEIRLLSYGADSLQAVVRQYRYGDGKKTVERFVTHEKGIDQPRWQVRGDVAVAAVTQAWRALGLSFPELSHT